MSNNKKDPIENILNLKSLKAIQDKIDLELDIYINKFNFKSLFDKYIEKVFNSKDNFLEKTIKTYLDRNILEKYLCEYLENSKTTDKYIKDYISKNTNIIQQTVEKIIPEIIKNESSNRGYIYDQIQERVLDQFEDNLKNLNIDFKINNIKK